MGSEGRGPRPATPDELIGMATIGRWLGLAPSRAHTITRDKTFPDPWYVGVKERAWLREDVVAWFDRYRSKRAAELDVEQPGWRDNPPPPGE